MNNLDGKVIHYRLLKLIQENGDLTQRKMAKEMGISLGKLNYCVSELTKKGMVKAIRFKNSKDKRAYVYLLTPRGLEEKVKLTISFLSIKLEEYEEIRKQIKDLSTELEEHGLVDISADKSLDTSMRSR